jgi:16S rRNA (adenine1518-N6/adenine1519-N6)-dimethyltransferase
MPRQRLGQHFLREEFWRARILSSLRVGSDDLWVEIGAGHGELTREIARSARRVIAIELDVRLLDALRRLAAEQTNITVVAGDVLALDFRQLLGTDRFRVYGSLPYYITSPILRRLFDHADQIESIHVVVQFEVAARLVARPGRRDYGFLSVLAQFYTQPEILFRIPPGAFRPRPRVASALVQLTLRKDRGAFGICDPADFLQFVGKCFEQKRKTLLNNLKPLAGADRAAAALRAAALKPQARAEELDLAQFIALYQIVGADR